MSTEGWRGKCTWASGWLRFWLTGSPWFKWGEKNRSPPVFTVFFERSLVQIKMWGKLIQHDIECLKSSIRPRQRENPYLSKWKGAWQVFTPRCDAWIPFVLLKSFKTQQDIFCQKYGRTKILHTPGKSIKQRSWPLSHRPRLPKKEKQNLQTDAKAKHEPGEMGEAGSAPVSRSASIPRNSLKLSLGKRNTHLQQLHYDLWLPRPKIKSIRNREENNILTVYLTRE